MERKDKITKLKGEGFLLQSDNDYYSLRFISKAGNMTTEEMKGISEIADKYGRGYIGFTTRLCVEVPWIKESDIDKVREEALRLGLRHGGTGKKLRPLVACKGTVCLHGNIDTQGICNSLANEHFAEDTPSKCKIGIAGCANNCSKANLNDIGIIGITSPKFNYSKCIGCGRCVKFCRQGALEVKEGAIVFHEEKCVDCGNCFRACKLGAVEAKETGCHIYIGGRFGRSYRFGTNLGRAFSEDEIESVVRKILTSYRTMGNPGERICHVIERVGEEKFISSII
ncbi:4Fe-4S binding protein [Clostridium hydrogeniformans]|uniref:4Fe-4S binding protein n=1 Tax=Clostridium hydrogeniformans TaxID=349933 RepID=UPI000482694A|nr:4Fe-4S binding protein [Clostridium hydrogeniformans]